MMENPKVSVWVITYNHDKFIERAIDSVLMQEIDFTYEIVIGDDCSRDNTRNILKEYRIKFPENIRLLLRERNIGLGSNFMQTYLACKGQYVAMLEGDDYWIDKHKLQKQVHEMDRHPECTICGHLVEARNEKGEYLYTYGPSAIVHGLKNIYEMEDIIKSNFIHTSGLMVRNHVVEQFPVWFRECLTADFVFQILHAMHGKIFFLPETMSVFNNNTASAWATKSILYKAPNAIKTYRLVDRMLDYKYHAIVKNVIAFWNFKCAYIHLKDGKKISAIQCMIKSFINAPVDKYRGRTPISYLKILIEMICPPLYSLKIKIEGIFSLDGK